MAAFRGARETLLWFRYGASADPNRQHHPLYTANIDHRRKDKEESEGDKLED